MTPVTLAERLAEVRPHGPGCGSSIHYSTVCMVVNGHDGRYFYLDLRPVAGLLGFDYAVVGRDWNAITVRRKGGEPDRDGIVWVTDVYRDPEEWATAVLALAPPERWTTRHPIFTHRTHQTRARKDNAS